MGPILLRLHTQEYSLKVQVPDTKDKMITVGKATLDLARYALPTTAAQSALVPITFKVGATTTGYLRLSISAMEVTGRDLDGLTETSGVTGLTSQGGNDQDLDGEPSADLFAWFPHRRHVTSRFHL